jgi:hypothetical protein
MIILAVFFYLNTKKEKEKHQHQLIFIDLLCIILSSHFCISFKMKLYVTLGAAATFVYNRKSPSPAISVPANKKTIIVKGGH